MRYLIVGLLFFSRLQADWNEDFAAQTKKLKEEFPEFQVKEYEKHQFFFAKVAQKISPVIVRQLEEAGSSDKFQILRQKEGLIYKKRKYNNMNELFAWELSFLFGVLNAICPSFPVEIDGKKVIMQSFESFSIGDTKNRLHHLDLLQKVSLKEYWVKNLFAYLLGMRDLPGPNIGVRENGTICFFDVEHSFMYRNYPSKAGCCVHYGFLPQSLDWPQYRMPIHRETAEVLREFVRGLDGIEEKLARYIAHRPLSLDWEGFQHRLDQVRSFPMERGCSFRDFYGFLFSSIDRGLDELNEIVGSILQRKVDHATSLFFIARPQHMEGVTSKQKKILKEWVQEYVD